jgi:hypothetical protein
MTRGRGNPYPANSAAMWSRCPSCFRLAHWGECEPAIAAGSRRAKTPQAVECEASQSGGQSRIAQETVPGSDMGKGE